MMEQIIKQITVNATIEKVWEYITDPKKLEQWLMPNDFDLKLNKKFTLTCEGHGDDAINCEVLEIIPHEKLVFSWHAEDIGAETTVTITVQPSNDGVVITLVHSGWDKFDDSVKLIRDQYDGGWHIFINENLKQVLNN